MRTNETFEQHLRKSNLSENTIHSYLWTVDFYHAHYDEVNKENLLAYKGYLMEFFKPKTVNLRIQAMNKYLEFLHKDRLRLKAVKVQQKNFLENVISNADYNFLKKQLKKDCNMEWYFVVWYLAATGARVSELIQIKIEHVELGYTHMKAILHKAGLPDIRFHDLRHTFATHAIASGVDAKTLSGILGHTNASFTLDTYTHVTPDMQKAASGIVGGFMEDLLGKGLRPWQRNGKAEPAP